MTQAEKAVAKQLLWEVLCIVEGRLVCIQISILCTQYACDICDRLDHENVRYAEPIRCLLITALSTFNEHNVEV